MAKLPTAVGKNAGIVIAKAVITHPTIAIGVIAITAVTLTTFHAINNGYRVNIRWNQYQGVDFNPV